MHTEDKMLYCSRLSTACSSWLISASFSVNVYPFLQCAELLEGAMVMENDRKRMHVTTLLGSDVVLAHPNLIEQITVGDAVTYSH